jgi:hypothetical protein
MLSNIIKENLKNKRATTIKLSNSLYLDITYYLNIKSQDIHKHTSYIQIDYLIYDDENNKLASDTTYITFKYLRKDMVIKYLLTQIDLMIRVANNLITICNNNYNLKIPTQT